MRHIVAIIVTFISILFFVSCKKDLLHWQKAQKIETNTTDRLNKILFINDTIGFIVGGQRFATTTILSTTNGGSSWQTNSFPQAGKALYGITQSASGIIYAIGFEGKMMTSNDTGKSWNDHQIGYEVPYTGVAFADAHRGILIGGINFESGFLVHINDNGVISRQDSLAYQLNDIEMPSASTGYIAGYGVIMKTTDSSSTWNLLNINNDNFEAVFCRSENDVWTCGYGGSIYHTTNGGDSWEQMRNGNDINIPRYHLFDIIFKDALNGWAVGENGLVIHTDDGGHHWMEYDKFTDHIIRSVAFSPNGDLLMAGDMGTVYRLSTKP
ncbi:MAG: hypothetical protein WCG87_07885 [Bacteroidota bacterium]